MGGFYNPQLGELKKVIEKNNKVGVKDLVYWGVTIGCALLAIFFGGKSAKLENNIQQINQHVTNIQNNNYYNSLPLAIQGDIKSIAQASADIVTNK